MMNKNWFYTDRVELRGWEKSDCDLEWSYISENRKEETDHKGPASDRERFPCPDLDKKISGHTSYQEKVTN